jgi:hypothetical protein
LKLKCDKPLSNVAFNFNGRRYAVAGALVGYDIFAWSVEAGVAGHVLELRGLNERMTLNVSVNFGGKRRQVATEIVPSLDISDTDSLGAFLEGLDSMIVCSGVPSRARGAIIPFQLILSRFEHSSAVEVELLCKLKSAFDYSSKTLVPDVAAYRQLASDCGEGFLSGSRATVETSRFIGFDGVVDWTIRSDTCDLLISRSAGRNCGGCHGYAHTMRSKLSYHNHVGLDTKKDPTSRAALSLIGPDLMRERIEELARLRKHEAKLADEREKVLLKQIARLELLIVDKVGIKHIMLATSSSVYS